MKTVMTVCGPINPDQLGRTLPHEHVVCDIARHSGNPDNLLTDLAACRSELDWFRRSGGGAIVDLTTPDIGRDAAALRQISEASGVHLITCTGWYTEKTAAGEIGDWSVDRLAAAMIREINQGIGDTNIRPGIIGELGCGNHYLQPVELKVLQAAARAHIETGLPISLHAAIGRPAVDQLAILREAGAALDRVVVGHCDYEWHRQISADLDYYQKILDAGCFLEFDQIGWGDWVIPEIEIVRRIQLLLEKGYVDRLLLSMDICRRSFYHQTGGHGYGYLLTDFADTLRKNGVSESQLTTILKDNPARMLAY